MSTRLATILHLPGGPATDACAGMIGAGLAASSGNSPGRQDYLQQQQTRKLEDPTELNTAHTQLAPQISGGCGTLVNAS